MALITVLATAVTLLPLFAGPSVETPTIIYFDRPFSVPLVITNESPIPISDLTYTCVVEEAKGNQLNAAWLDLVAVENQHHRLVWGQKMSARCDTAIPISGLQYSKAILRIEIKYSPEFWFGKHLSTVASYDAIINGQGLIVRWVPR